jgi:hypothetical protein
MNRSSTHTDPLDAPGLAATLLAPEDRAMRELFDRLGAYAAPLAEQGVGPNPRAAEQQGVRIRA